MDKKVLVTATNYSKNCPAGKKMLVDAGFKIIENDKGRPMTFEERAPYLGEICAVVAGADVWDKTVFEKAPNLKVIARFGVGIDQIDLAAAKVHGIKVAIARGANADSVAEFALAGMLCVLRNAVNLDRSTRQGKWERYVGYTLHGKRIGLVGFGAIAQYLAGLLSSFGVNIVAYDVVQDKQAAGRLNVKFVPFEELIATSDIISLHVPGMETTRNMINAEVIEKMKPTAVLVNTARGCVIDEKALYDALKARRILGAALDVHAVEPSAVDNPLFSLNNIVTFPHTASETYETYHSIGIFTSQVVLDVIEHGMNPANWINN